MGKMSNYQFDSLKFATEGLTGFGTTVIQNQAGLPSFMVPVNKRTNAQLFGGSEKTHSAFVVDDVEYDRFLASKFINCIIDGYALSWPGMDPKANITFDQAMAACNANGDGFHMMSIPERAVIDWLIYKSGFVPHGNTSYGSSHKAAYEVGEPSMARDSSNRIQRTATGSGPATWFHDGTRSGIADWVGDVWKWFSNMRIVDGEIQIFVGNLAAKQVSHAASSTYWKAILPSGQLVEPGTAGTLKFTSTLTIGTDRVAAATPSKAFSAIAAASGVSIPEIIKELHLIPVDGITGYEGTVYLNTDGERLPFGGGGWGHTSYAGPSALSLGDPRSNSSASIGFFSAFMEL